MASNRDRKGIGGVFYKKTMLKLLASGAISVDDRVLVICGGPYDADVLSELGFKRVVITNPMIARSRRFRAPARTRKI
jgi:hypothetical protein